MDILTEFFPKFMHFSRLEATNLILLLGFILLLGSIGGRVFQNLKIPQVVGYIVIGILIGQSGFQVLSANVITALEPLSSIALSLIGFMIGGELKIHIIKKYGKQFIGILFFESITPFIIVSTIITVAAFLILHDITIAFSLGLILGAISSATAPAATTDVLRENRTRGPLTTTTLGIVAMDDAVALVLYAFASSVSANLLGTHTVSFGQQILALLLDIGGSIALGSTIGFFLSFIIRNVMTEQGRILGFSLGSLFLSTGIASFFGLDSILAAMSLGFFMVNFAPAATRQMFTLIENFTPPIYVLFFVLVGAKLNIWNINVFIGILAVTYVILRTIGKSVGSMFGAWLTKAPDTVRKYLPFCLLSQAGVAIGLSIAAGNDFHDSVGPTILLIITATTFIVQLIGPICVRYAVVKAGECNLDITEEDLLQTMTVSNVLWSNEPLCSTSSPTIVTENERLVEIIDSFSKYPNLNYAVRNQANKLVGIITLDSLKESLIMSEWHEHLLAMDIMQPTSIVCSPSTKLIDLYKMYAEKDCNAIPIADAANTALGIVEKNTVERFLHQHMIEIHKKAAQ